MTTELYIKCFLISVLGMFFSIIMQVRSLIKKSKAANTKFSLKSYFKSDWISGIASITFICIVLVIIAEVIKMKPVVINYIKIIFILVGYFGADLGYRIFSATDKKITQIIDEKTNKADSMID